MINFDCQFWVDDESTGKLRFSTARRIGPVNDIHDLRHMLAESAEENAKEFKRQVPMLVIARPVPMAAPGEQMQMKLP